MNGESDFDLKLTRGSSQVMGQSNTLHSSWSGESAQCGPARGCWCWYNWHVDYGLQPNTAAKEKLVLCSDSCRRITFSRSNVHDMTKMPLLRSLKSESSCQSGGWQCIFCVYDRMYKCVCGRVGGRCIALCMNIWGKNSANKESSTVIMIMFYFQALREEEKQYADTKRNLREQIRDIRRTVSLWLLLILFLKDFSFASVVVVLYCCCCFVFVSFILYLFLTISSLKSKATAVNVLKLEPGMWFTDGCATVTQFLGEFERPGHPIVIVQSRCI